MGVKDKHYIWFARTKSKFSKKKNKLWNEIISYATVLDSFYTHQV